jgi:hypothetical protein
LYGQEKNNLGLEFQVTINDKGSCATSSGEQDKFGFMTGRLFGSPGRSTGTGETVDFFFLEGLSDFYWKYKDTNEKSISDEELDKIYKSGKFKSTPVDGLENIINFSFYPAELYDNNKARIYCKYIIHRLVKEKAPLKYEYEVSYQEEFLTITFGEKFELDFIKKIFNKEEVYAIINKPNSELKNLDKNEYVNVNTLYGEAKEIIKTIKNSAIKENDISFGVEYVRVDKMGKQILSRKMDYPLKEVKKLVYENDVINLENKLYIGEIEIPFEQYNVAKSLLFEKSRFKGTYSNYSICIAPVVKENNNYVLDIFLKLKVGGGIQGSKTPIKIAPNTKYKLTLPGLNFRFGAEVGKEKLVIESQKDIYDYVDEYLIISFDKK